MRLRFLVAAASIATIGLGLPAAAGAQPAITCGMTVSTSITLTQDLSCPSTAFEVAADPRGGSVTIDLGGHTVTSVTGPTIDAEDSGTTMTLQNGRVVTGDNTTSVRDDGNGNVYQHLVFDKGILISVDDSYPRVLHNAFIHGAGVYAGENAIDVEHNTFSGASAPGRGLTGAAVVGSLTYTTVIDNTITGYDTAIEVSDELASADIRGNVLLRNGDGIHVIGAGRSIPVTIKNNVVIASRRDGIIIGDDTTSTVSGNTTVLNGGDGIRVDPTSISTINPPVGLIATLARNVSVANVGWGIEAPPASAHVAVVDGGHNVAHFNRAGQCLNIACH